MGSRVSLLVLLVVMLAAALAIGYRAGRSAGWEKDVARMEAVQAAETLGTVALDPDETALAFEDPGAVRGRLDEVTWTVANLPTPFVGSAPVPGQHVSAYVNAMQMRHPTELELPKPAGVFRVFVTGGSTAFGTGAPSDETTVQGFLREIARRELGARAEQLEIVNTANPGWASTHERILIENRLSEMQPDLVVSLSGNNDAHYGFLGLDVLWFRSYAEHHFALCVMRVYELIGDGPLERPWSPIQDGPFPPAEVLRKLTKNLRLATCALEPAGVPYVFALQPTLAETGKTLSQREQRHLAREHLGPGCTEYFRDVYRLFERDLPAVELPNFTFVDLSDAFDELGAEDEVFLDSYHFADRGNRIVAERLFRALRPFLE